MPLVPAKCPECGGLIEVDNEKRAGMCQHCGEAFTVEDAIQTFNTYYQTTNNYNTTHNYGEGAVVNIGNYSSVENDLKRAYVFLEQQQWESAYEYAEKVHDYDIENAEAYLVKLLSYCKIRRVEDLAKQKTSFKHNPNYINLLKYGDDNLKSVLTSAEEKATKTENELKQQIFEQLEQNIIQNYVQRINEIKDKLSVAQSTVDYYKELHRIERLLELLEKEEKELHNLDYPISDDSDLASILRRVEQNSKNPYRELSYSDRKILVKRINDIKNQAKQHYSETTEIINQLNQSNIGKLVLKVNKRKNAGYFEYNFYDFYEMSNQRYKKSEEKGELLGYEAESKTYIYNKWFGEYILEYQYFLRGHIKRCEVNFIIHGRKTTTIEIVPSFFWGYEAKVYYD